MKINKIFILISLFLVLNVCAKETKKEEYLLLYWLCPYAIDRQFSTTDLDGPLVDYIYNQQTEKIEPKLYTKEECVNEIKNKMDLAAGCVTEYSRDDYIKYISGGLYMEGAGYYRYVCAKYEDIKDYIDKKDNHYLNYSILPKEFYKKCPSEVDENNLQIFNNIFPLDDDEKESIEFTKKFDDEMRERVKMKVKKSKEEDRKINEEERKRKREKQKNK